MRIFSLSLLIILLSATTYAQDKPAVKKDKFETDFDKEYQRRIQKECLYRVYIPKDLADAFVNLNRLTDKESIAKFKNASEEDAAIKLRASLGRWMTYNWGFYRGSRLSHYLKKIGLSHPEDMAQFIIITYHRNLNKKKLDVKALIESIQANRQKEVNKRRTILHEETRQRPPKKILFFSSGF